ncbi:MAG TPA: hypothetical protein VLA88_00625 [Candidatus Saccharimonadales bacterium]|nr:hypothetical protein [Candidatus Saccharimonadales bacterium]
MAFAKFTHGKYGLAEQTAEELWRLLIRLYGGADALPAPAGLFCRDLIHELMRNDNTFILTVNGITDRHGEVMSTTTMFLLPASTGPVEIELGQITLGGVVYWKGHAAE